MMTEPSENLARRTDELAAAHARLRCEIAHRKGTEEAVRRQENRYHILFDDSPLALCEEDWSRVQDYLNAFIELGIHDIGRYFEDHPEAVRDCVDRIEVRQVNKAALRLLAVRSEDDLSKGVMQFFSGETFETFREVLLALAEGKRHFQCETICRTRTRKTIPVAVSIDVTPGSEAPLDRLLVSLMDLSDGKRAEERLLKEQRLLRQALDIYERQLEWMATEIHDAVAQPLAAALMNLDGLLPMMRSGRTDLAEESFTRATELLRDCIARARRMMSELRPPVLDEFGILVAIEYLVCECEMRSSATVAYSHDVRFQRLSPPLETAIFRMVQECLSNAQKHSASDRINVRLCQQDNWLEIHIEDWGVGFEPERIATDRFGLEGLRERAQSFGGDATIDSAPGKGTRILVRLPVLERPAAEA